MLTKARVAAKAAKRIKIQRWGPFNRLRRFNNFSIGLYVLVDLSVLGDGTVFSNHAFTFRLRSRRLPLLRMTQWALLSFRDWAHWPFSRRRISLLSQPRANKRPCRARAEAETLKTPSR